MQDDSQPFFRFSPKAYFPGFSFESSDVDCAVCGKPSVWRYASLIYTAQDKPDDLCVCARCISDGQIQNYLGTADYRLHDIDCPEINPKYADELFRKTPGFSTWNAFTWPVIEGRPLAFYCYWEKRFSQIFNAREVQEAVKQETAAMGWDEPYALHNALVFKDIDQPIYRIWFDLD